jgi:hypothetical protein
MKLKTAGASLHVASDLNCPKGTNTFAKLISAHLTGLTVQAAILVGRAGWERLFPNCQDSQES